MNSRGRMLAALGAGVLGLVLLAGVLGTPALAQQPQKPQPQKLDKAQMQEAQALTAAVDAAQYGDPVASDIPATFESYNCFRSSNGQTYVPFTFTVDGRALGDQSVALLIRVVKKGDAAAPAQTAGTDKGKRAPLPAPAYFDLEFPVLKAEAGQTARLSRAFQVPGGDYDLYIGIKEKDPADKKLKARLAVMKQPIAAASYQPAEFATSSVVVAEDIQPLQAALKAEQQRENPYALGMLQLLPKTGTKFAADQELLIYFQIYNQGLDATTKKPDVVVEYLFYKKQGANEVKHANAEPRAFNATTVPNFDPAKNLLLQEVGSWPLQKARFPAGDYRLEIKVQDKVSGKTLTHSVNFSVS